MMRAVTLIKHGGPEVLKIGEVPVPVLGPDEVLIKVSATSINRADILQRKGLYPPPKGYTEILGLECAGTVSAGSHWPIGTRVMGFLRGGGYAEYAKVHKSQVLPIPDGMSFTNAAAIAEVWLTAYKCLVHLAKGKAGENVLIHAGASGVGSASIQLAKHLGLKSFVTCSGGKMKHCSSLGADFVWDYNEGKFSEKIRDIDVILDCVGKDYFDGNLEALRQGGRWVVYGFLSGSKVEGDLMKIFSKHGQIFFTSFRSRSDEFRGEVVRRFLEDRILDGFVSGKFDPCVFKVIELGQVAEGHEIIGRNESSGKIVMVL